MTRWKAICYVLTGWARPVDQQVELFVRVRCTLKLTPKTQERTITVKEIVKVFRKRGYVIDEVDAFSMEKTMSYIPMENKT